MYLYDARYNLKTITDFKKLNGIFGLRNTILINKKNEFKPIKKYYYIIDDDTSIKDLKKIYASVKYKDEIWKEIDGGEGLYFISNYGRFKRKYKDKFNFVMPYFQNRKINLNKNKQFVKVKFKNIYKEYNVARLVAYHFVDIYYFDLYGARKDIKYKKYKFEDLTVYHKNGIVYDNHAANLEFLDNEDLGKKNSGFRSKGGTPIIGIDVINNRIVGNFKSSRHAASILPISSQAVHDSLNHRWSSDVVGGRYKFIYEKDEII